MTQKVLKVGTSAAVTISKGALRELGLDIGDQVDVEFDRKRKSISIRPHGKLSREDMKMAKLALDFIERYREDLEALARK